MKTKALKLKKNKKVLIVAAGVLLLGVTAAAMLWQGRPAAALAKVCAGEKLNDASCHADYFEDITRRHGSAAAFEQLREAYAEVPLVKTNCHPLTHVIGRAAAINYGSVSEAYAHGDNFCWSGYYHGVMEEMISQLGAEEVTADADSICDAVAEDRYSFHHYNCVHGLGHGFMLITHNELHESLVMCDSLGDSWERKSCYGGVFMENIMSGTESNIGHETEYLKDDDPLYPCTAVGDKYRQQCFAMQTSRALDVLGRDFGQVFALCAGVEADYVSTCYSSLGRDASGSTNSDPERTRDICMKGESFEARRHCVSGAVKDFISYHHDDVEAKVFCDSLPEDLKGNCHGTAREYYGNF